MITDISYSMSGKDIVAIFVVFLSVGFVGCFLLSMFRPQD
jgi:hypothetical protein